MNGFRARWFGSCSTISLLLLLAGSTSAAPNHVELGDALSILSAASGNPSLIDQYDALAPDEQRYVLKSFGPNAGAFVDAVQRLESVRPGSEAAQSDLPVLQQGIAPAMSFAPRYPEGPTYLTFVDNSRSSGCC